MSKARSEISNTLRHLSVARCGAPRRTGCGSGDAISAKFVWSPLSNLQLYGCTANVYKALAAGSWFPRNRLDAEQITEFPQPPTGLKVFSRRPPQGSMEPQKRSWRLRRLDGIASLTAG